MFLDDIGSIVGASEGNLVSSILHRTPAELTGRTRAFATVMTKNILGRKTPLSKVCGLAAPGSASR